MTLTEDRVKVTLSNEQNEKQFEYTNYVGKKKPGCIIEHCTAIIISKKILIVC